MNHGGRCHRPSGFTLVELLVTIAVVVILATLLIPVLKGAQASAKSAVCLNNLKQIRTYLQLYANDNDGYLPKVWDGVKQWNVVLCETVAAPDIAARKNFALWHCPSWGPAAGDCFPLHPSYSVNFSYGLTMHSSSALPPDKLISLPPSTILLADTLYNPTGPSTTPWQAYFFLRGIPTTSQLIHLRHNHRANAVFVDGHAASLSKQDVLDSGVISVSDYGGK
ncbi:MAG: prepilin-type N-terminal cleavage/methylation domain-containing protein [Phycisphaerae bacterium]|jgi:prepilin-type N-terminal cleavage/methylation domain-containing protein/prepilin-type processing-associated H-X9-DG protein